MIKQYRKKPVVIEAMQYTDETFQDVCNWAKCDCGIRDGSLVLFIRTLEGDMTVKPGDYVIKGVNGEFYPCKPDIFEKTYEQVQDGAQ